MKNKGDIGGYGRKDTSRSRRRLRRAAKHAAWHESERLRFAPKISETIYNNRERSGGQKLSGLLYDIVHYLYTKLYKDTILSSLKRITE